MKPNSLFYILCFLVFAPWSNAQQSTIEIRIDFPVGISTIEPGYRDNTEKLDEIATLLGGISRDKSVSVTSISLRGSASPEDSYQLNTRLADERMSSLENLIKQYVDLNNGGGGEECLITRDNRYIPWDTLKTMIQASTLPESYKAKAISIINEKPELVNYNHEDGQQVDNRIIKLKALQSGEVWRVIETQFFSQMRNACAVIVTVRTQPKEEPAPAPSTSSPKESTPLLYSPELSQAQADEPAKPLNLTLKTNLIGLAAVIGNVGVEIDIAEHWSVTMPIFYSSLDYFKSTLKFRTFCAQPELRYWFKGNDGWFIGAHAGIAWYNFALDGKWRFQDHKGRTPMFDKGIGAGYRTALGKHSRWALEFTLGCGTGNLKYDRFINVPKGQKVTTIEKTFIGIDNAAVSLCYRFDIKRRNK